jgi:hypothetical protein
MPPTTAPRRRRAGEYWAGAPTPVRPEPGAALRSLETTRLGDGSQSHPTLHRPTSPIHAASAPILRLRCVSSKQRPIDRSAWLPSRPGTMYGDAPILKPRDAGKASAPVNRQLRTIRVEHPVMGRSKDADATAWTSQAPGAGNEFDGARPDFLIVPPRDKRSGADLAAGLRRCLAIDDAISTLPDQLTPDH